MAAKVGFSFATDAEQTVERAAWPALMRAGKAIEAALPGYVPVHTGVMQDSYQPVTVDTGQDVRMHVGSPFWHWMEYGTRWNPPYRPVQRTVESLDLRFVAS